MVNGSGSWEMASVERSVTMDLMVCGVLTVKYRCYYNGITMDSPKVTQ